MATATMATAAGAAALLYYTMNRKLQTNRSNGDDDEENGGDAASEAPLGIERVSHRLIQAPATWLEAISTLSETLRFTYSETLGKWPIGDLAFGISFLLKRQGNLHVDSVFGGSDSVLLKGPEIAAELRYLVTLLTLCWHFSKKPFPVFLEETGYSTESVLLQEPKAGILKPAFTILVDHSMKCFLLLIRGTHSIKDTLTAATGAVVPFHHSVVHEGGVSNLVLGYAHCGMVAAARWIAKLASPCLIKALGEYPGYKLKIVGHSLGGGTAALLTYILREKKEFSTTTCVAFAPAACMTWELAESGNEFITSVVNGADLVPTFSAASVDDLRAEVVMKRAQSMAQAAWTRPALHLSSWSCMGPRRRATAADINSKAEGSSPESSTSNTEASDPLISSLERTVTTTAIETLELPVTSSVGTKWMSEIECSYSDEIGPHADEDADISDGEGRTLTNHNSQEDCMTEVELWEQLEHELYDWAGGEEADVVKGIREEEAAAIAEVGEDQPESSTREINEVHRFYPAGRIMHIVSLSSDGAECESDVPTTSGSDNGQVEETKVQIFLTPRSLYSKLRLSHTMISDHFMPVYRRRIERLIKDFETEEGVDEDKTGDVVL
ncbi:Sn1-specific diacylglycerol lipase alpha [Morella rubra]|uniref:Sn1-specific diacylglycerol lipase alpha n=1 Tax=Morella rubra TaxID=262757 RepID=A0A6A1VZE2_9ROSI|nr:Sn1-specific diacylglycerol lipase alpha [Morella rubra]